MSLPKYEMHHVINLTCWLRNYSCFFVSLPQGQIDGNVVKAKFTLPARQKLSPPPKPVSSVPKREAPKSDSAGADIEKDGPGRPRESTSMFIFFCFCCDIYFIWCQ